MGAETAPGAHERHIVEALVNEDDPQRTLLPSATR